MSVVESGGTGGPPTLAYLGRRALRFWRSAGIVFALVVAGTLVYARSAWQPYRSEAVLMYDQALPRDMGAVDPLVVGGRIKEMIFSTERVRKVVQKYDLFPELSNAQGIEETKKRLNFQVQPGGAFQVSYVGFSPQQAQGVLRDLTESVILDDSQVRTKQVKDQRQFLDDERKQLQDVIATRDAALRDFLAKHPEAAQINDQIQLTDPSVVMIEQQLANLRSQARSARSSSGEGGPSRSTSELVDMLRMAGSEREKAQQNLQDKLDTLTEAHPDVIVARERLKRAQSDEARLRAQLEKASVGTTGNKGPSADDVQIKELEGRLSELRTASRSRRTKDPKTLQLEVQLQDLRHNLDEARDRLSKLEDQQVQANVMEKMESSGNLMHLGVHDPASMPGTPMQSRRRRIAMGGFFLACLLGVGMALGRAMVSDRIFDRTDIMQLAGVGVLTVVPVIPKRLRRSGG